MPIFQRILLFADRSGFYSRLSNTFCNMLCNAFFERTRNDILCGEFVRCYKLSDRLGCSNLHILVDISCAAV